MDLAMLPKTIRASYDLSAPLRQGWVLLFNNPKLWAKAFNAQLKLVLPGGDAGALQLNNSIMRHPSFKMYTDIAKLSLTDVTGVSTRSVKEEAFLSNLARMIPGSRASERAYTGFLNKLRMDTMDNYAKYRPKVQEDLYKLGFNKSDVAYRVMSNIALQVAFCRLKYRRDRKAIPSASDIEGQAKYWKRVYNTRLGKGTIEHFLEANKDYKIGE